MSDFLFTGSACTTRRPAYYEPVTIICTATELSSAQRGAVSQDTLLVLQNKPDYAPALGVFGREPIWQSRRISTPADETLARAEGSAWLQDRVTVLPGRAPTGSWPKYPFAWWGGLPVEASKWQGVVPWFAPTNASPPPGVPPNTPGVTIPADGLNPIRHVAPGSLAGQHRVWAVIDIHITR
jgi:hypothetical protein